MSGRHVPTPAEVGHLILAAVGDLDGGGSVEAATGVPRAIGEVRWYRYSHDAAGPRLLVTANTAGAAASPLAVDVTPTRHRH